MGLTVVICYRRLERVCQVQEPFLKRLLAILLCAQIVQILSDPLKEILVSHFLTLSLFLSSAQSSTPHFLFAQPDHHQHDYLDPS